MSNSTKLLFGLKDGECVHIDSVESGLKCGCFCPACGEALVAKKGSKNAHHFSHYSASNCEYGYESALHQAAKVILSNSKKMVLPPIEWNNRSSGRYHLKMDGNLHDSTEIVIDNVELECRFGNIVPDIVVYSGGKKFFIEIYVSHEVDEEKLEKLKKTGISTLQIDLSKKDELISQEELENVLLNGVEEKEWLYNSFAEKQREKIIGACSQLFVSSVKSLSDVKCCPLFKRRFAWKGNYFYFANLEYDCFECRFYKGDVYFDDSYESYILCSGNEYISSIDDFKIPQKERYKMRNEERRIKKLPEDFERCKYCGEKLEERIGPNGRYICCSKYPKCRYVY
ncbi:MAG: topoisomerase DNA-binding C4 zinc finger domain-containing protein [Clostridia bacterium]|nr:topoisomerase DNA-binding C4 zinc finger domain-containing protein [Clostridia bacterium]